TGPSFGVTFIVEQLVLRAWGGGTLLADEVFDAAVAVFTDAPVPCKLEIAEISLRHDVAAGLVRDFFQDAFRDLPASAGFVRAIITFPAAEISTVEKELPAFSFFLIA